MSKNIGKVSKVIGAVVDVEFQKKAHCLRYMTHLRLKEKMALS